MILDTTSFCAGGNSAGLSGCARLAENEIVHASTHSPEYRATERIDTPKPPAKPTASYHRRRFDEYAHIQTYTRLRGLASNFTARWSYLLHRTIRSICHSGGLVGLIQSHEIAERHGEGHLIGVIERVETQRLL